MNKDQLVPACGGTEPVSIINGRRWQYCYHPATGRHCYLDVDNDIPTWHRSFHPAYAPQFEGQDEPIQPKPRAKVTLIPGQPAPVIPRPMFTPVESLWV